MVHVTQAAEGESDAGQEWDAVGGVQKYAEKRAAEVTAATAVVAAVRAQPGAGSASEK